MIKYIQNILSIARYSLLGEITPNLRAVTVNIDVSKLAYWIVLFYDGAIDETLREDALNAIDEFMEDLENDLFATCRLNILFNNISEEITRLDYPKIIPVQGRLAYLRKEPKFCLDHAIEPLFKYDRDVNIGQMTTTLEPKIFLEKYELSLRRYMRLIAQEALLGEVTPNLRAIAIDWSETDNYIYLFFYYDSEITEVEKQDVSIIVQKTAVGFCGQTKIIEKIIQIKSTAPIPKHRELVYLRK